MSRTKKRTSVGPTNYSGTKVPKGYVCTDCGRCGCKLWREYQTFADFTNLYCVDCAGKNQKKGVKLVDEQGFRLTDDGRTDQIGWLVPAVPTEEGDTFWGYCSVPDEGVAWWRKLPLRVKK